MNRLAQTYAALDRHKDALKLREEVLKIWIAQFEADPPRWLRDRHEVLPRDFVEMVELLKTAADSHAGLGRHADAAVQYARVMELYKALFARYREEAPNYRAEVALTVAKLGEAQLLGTGKIEEAEARLAEARKLADHPAVLDRIGSAYARAGQWNKAAAAYGHRAELSPGHEHWYRAASLYLAAGDHEAYRRACREMIERYCQEGETLHPQIAGRTAVACSLASNAVPDFRVVERLAERAVTATEKFPDHHDFAWARGLAEYRAGRHAGAIEWLKRSKPSDIGSGRDATVFAALAMANHRIGEAKQAKASLAKAKAIVAERMPDPARGRPFAPGDWHDWLHAQILIREAEGVVKEKAGDKKSTLTEPD
jgi:tetratricopeptide (TPR) repeat protein